MHINGLRHTEPATPGRIRYTNIGRTHAGTKRTKCAVGTRMAISTHNNATRQNKTFFRHYLVADALLQNLNALLACKGTGITLKGRSSNRRSRNDVVEDN